MILTSLLRWKINEIDEPIQIKKEVVTMTTS